MLEKIAKPKVLIVAAILMTIFVLVCLFLSVGAGWSAIRQRVQTSKPAPEPISFEYCGAELTELCVVSFGRDAFGSTIINLYVPQRTYPPFYLNVVRGSEEDMYDCQVNRNVLTSIYCIGATINLGEGFEIQVRTKAENQVLARGTFTLTAFLITTQIVNGEAAKEETPEQDSSFLTEETSTPTATLEDKTVTPAPTGTSSSSSYPYP